MTDSNDQTDKTIRVGARKQLSLQRTVESGHVRQNFSQGRSKSVVVEKKKTRRIGLEGEAGVPTSPSGPIDKTQQPTRVPSPPQTTRHSSSDRSAGCVLSNAERAARERALAAARAAAEEQPPSARSEPAVSSTETAAQIPTQALALAPAALPASSTPTSSSPAVADCCALREEARRDSGPGHTPSPRGEGGRPQFQRGHRPSANTAFMPREAGRPREIEFPIPARRGAAASPADVSTIEKTSRPIRLAVAREQVEEEDVRRRGPGGAKVPRPAVKANDDGRQRQKLTITNFDREAQVRSLASLKRKREKEKLKAMGIQQPREKIAREVVIPEAITIQELSNRMAERAVDLIRYLMQQGAMHKITDVLDVDTAELIVQEFGHTPKRVSEADVEIGFVGGEDANDSALDPRTPVVTIMGHVDHGKTSLLDAIRQANVVASEAGGITQHIGAYQVTAPDGIKITFIDTPGHEAFTAMRARGAKVTDIVLLVIAADDGVMPQTVEAINHAKAANVPMIVVINKIDKPQADPDRVRTELLSHEIVVESMGGETLEVPVSALKQTNLNKLLEAIRLQAEVLDLKANPNRTADGVVIEAKLERGRGPVGTVLVQRGTLHVGDIIVAGTAWGRVRALLNDRGANIKLAGPSVPAEVLGFDSAPDAGDQFAVVENEARARELTDYRARKRREALGSAGSKSTLEQMMQQLKDAGRKEFPLVVKGDVQGSVEAIAGVLNKAGNSEVEARLVHSSVGSITESDIALAAAAKAVVIGFNVRANTQAKQAADAKGVEIRYYNVIYDLLNEIKAAMSGLLVPTKHEIFLGYATIKQVFSISKTGKVAGCIVTEGKVERGAKVRLLRDNVVVHEGTLAILKRFKDDVKEVVAGQKCGMSFTNFQDLREGDQIECFQIETVARSL